MLVYFSSQSRNTQRFIERVGEKAAQIPTSPKSPMLKVTEPFILVVPTYAGDQGEGAVPKQVIKFLNDPENRSFLKGVVASGNRNFGRFYGYAGDVISAKCKVPYLYRFELMGTPEDIENVRNGVRGAWFS